jgi:hypothetical protein
LLLLLLHPPYRHILDPRKFEDDNYILAINYDNVWKEGSVNPQHAIRGFHSAAITADGYDHTATLLTENYEISTSSKG